MHNLLVSEPEIQGAKWSAPWSASPSAPGPRLPGWWAGRWGGLAPSETGAPPPSSGPRGPAALGKTL